ncbi:MAG: hypothetical protein ABIN94_01490 [Ferruginibacter sp.]
MPARILVINKGSNKKDRVGYGNKNLPAAKKLDGVNIAITHINGDPD